MPNPDATAREQAQQPLNVAPITCTGVELLLLDIEGTTCPVTFVSDTLFPYAAEAMEGFLQREAPRRAEVRELLNAVEQSWLSDSDPAATALRKGSPTDVAAYLRQLIQRDSKLPALKELQGLVWRAGYANAALVAPLFADVAEALRRWKAAGLGLAVYSSGSTAAQQLLYSHSNAGDLSTIFSHWFDTRMGPKHQSESYAAIATRMELEPKNILFISDSTAECRAAQVAGMQVLFSSRSGNPNRESEGFTTISNFGQLIIGP
ncbi:acireductone synthase [Cyanobium sp. ATX 6A2]|uniref:acireductone synthase n=1 Tax=Cyanobium sp. ATX 6A2 TaxID=2823700 RepID=UPI0020CB8063|nr:acireductone synthase [Cyanobium sp. ATX 6A2]MCP9886826.1 acireductone synthase [Cyanobium sp. ATX 6A2]